MVGKGLSKDKKAKKLALQHWLEAEDGWLSRGDYLTESAHKVQKRLPMAGRISSKSVACKGKATVGKVNTGSRSIKEQTGPGSLAAAAISNETREYLMKALLQVFSDRKARRLQMEVTA